MTKKIILRSLLALAIILVLSIIIVLIMAPGMAKDYVNENGRDLMGRKISVENIDVSYYSLSANIEDFTIYEKDTITPFFSFDTLIIDLNLWDLLSSHIHIESGLLSGTYVHITKNQSEFNFDDITEFFSDTTENEIDTAESEPFQYTIQHFDFRNGHVAFHAQKIDEHIDLKDIDFFIPTISWSRQEVESGLAFNFAHGGSLHTDFDIDVDSSTFDIRVNMDSLGIEPGTKVVKNSLNIGEIYGLLNLDVRLTGHLDHFDQMRIEGITRLNDVSVTHPDGSNMISWDSLFVDLHDIDLLEKEIIVNEAQLYHPVIDVALLENGSSLDTLVVGKPDSLKRKKAPEERQPWTYSFDILSLNNGVINIGDSTLEIPQTISLTELNAEFDYFSSKDTTSPLKFHTLINEKAMVDIEGSINLAEDFNVDIAIKDLDASLGKEYMKKGMRVGDVAGKIDLKMHAQGPVKNVDKLSASLDLDFHDFALSTFKNDELVSWNNFHVDVEEFDLAKQNMKVKDVTLDGLQLHYIQNPKTSNFDDLSKTPKDTTENEKDEESDKVPEEKDDQQQPWNYNISQVNIKDGIIHYQDFTLENEFDYDLEKLTILLENITSKNEMANLNFSTEIQGGGVVEVKGKINTYTAQDFDLDLLIKDVVLIPFTPFSYHHIGNNIERGRLSHTADIDVTNGIIESDHNLHMAAFDLSKRINKDSEHNLPVRLGVEMLKDKDSNIDLDFQIEGNMNDPDFSIGKIIWKTLGNIVSKAAASPGKSMGTTFGGDTSSFKPLQFDYLETTFDKKQKKELDLIELVLDKKEKLKVRLVHYPGNEKTAAKLALQKALLEYYAENTGKEIDKLNSQDSLNSQNNLNTEGFRVFIVGFGVSDSDQLDELCLAHYGKNSFTAEVNAINQKREEILSDYMLKTKAIKRDRFVIARRNDEEGKKECLVEIEFDLVDE